MTLTEKLKKIINGLLASDSHIENINIKAIIEDICIDNGYILRKDTGRRILTICYLKGPEDTI
jgi:hypothetical protein